jgi:cell division septum initiation protein DivIVA
MSGSNEKLRVLRRIPEIRFDEELRGYNKHQVDRVLENLAPLADEVDALIDRLGESERRAAAAEARVMEGGGPAPVPQPPVAPSAPAPDNFDETLSKTLVLAQRTADATVQEAEQTAAAIKAEAEAEAAATREAVEQEAEAMRVSAAEERSASIEQANREVTAMIDAARATIDSKVAEAEAELAETHVSTRDDLIEQIGSLQRARDALSVDVELFEGHLAERREVIRTAIAELSEVVENPERLRTVMPPSPIDEEADLGSTEPVTIDVVSLDTLAAQVAEDAEEQGLLTPDLSSSNDDAGGTWSDGETGWSESESTWSEPTVDDDALSAGLLIEAASDSADELAHDGDPTQAVPVIDPMPIDAFDDDMPVDDGPVRATLDDLAPNDVMPDDLVSAGVDESPGDTTSDPFLDELRRVTSDDEDDEALSNFLNDAEGDDDGKGGWFGRRK